MNETLLWQTPVECFIFCNLRYNAAMPQAIEITPGIYQHYKGGKYTVLFVADDSTDAREGNKVVVYIALVDGSMQCRDLNEFTEIVDWPDGGRKPRFIGVFTSHRRLK